MQSCANSRQPIDTYMDKIFLILEERIDFYLENIKTINNQVDDVLELYEIPSRIKNFSITRKQAKELEQTKTKLKQICKELSLIICKF